ncbi:MAG TPA: hypothetical protein VGB18_04805 [Candidatus Thermoplasmatota archaeon]
MAIPKAKHGEPKKKKSTWAKLKGSALFILSMIVLLTTIIVVLILMLSSLLANGDPRFWQ